MKAKIENCEGFAWDEGNPNKNWHLHAVTDGECEDVFFNVPLIIASDKKHTASESRFFAFCCVTRERDCLSIGSPLRVSIIAVIGKPDQTAAGKLVEVGIACGL